ncbi:MAG: hypothetical protein ACYC96_13295 [Fimbriimonadaceae bacterium]
MLTRDRVADEPKSVELGPGTRVVRSERARSFVTFLMVMGPGLIVMEADNDAGAVQTYTQAGARL